MGSFLLWVSLSFAVAAQPVPPSAKRAMPPAGVDVQARRLPKIAPGAEVDPGPPPGWSHLLIAAYPRLGTGDANRVSRTVLRLGSLITFTMAANVVSQDLADGKPRFQLQKVGWGLGTRIKGRNTIISADTHARLGADLGYIGAEVLRRNEEGLQNSFLQVAQSNTLVVCDYGSLVHQGGQHRWMTIRHAVLVDEVEGTVTTFAWLLKRLPDQTYALAENHLQFLPPNLREDRVFHVDGEQFVLGIPKSEAFAVEKIPQGTPVSPSAELQSLAALRRFTPEQAVRLEAALRQLLPPKDKVAAP